MTTDSMEVGLHGETGAGLTAALTDRAAQIEACLDNLLPLEAGLEARLIEAMRYAVLGGGKRLRGFLVMEVASLFKVAPACAARVAASVEMLHAYSLVHDDLPAMDDDDLRRGKPSTPPRFRRGHCHPGRRRVAGPRLRGAGRGGHPLRPVGPLRAGLCTRTRVGRARHGRRPDDRHGVRGAVRCRSARSPACRP